jgi:hypothetical protein
MMVCVNIHGYYHMITKVINVERTSASSTSASIDTFVVELRVLSRNKDGTSVNCIGEGIRNVSHLDIGG